MISDVRTKQSASIVVVLGENMGKEESEPIVRLVRAFGECFILCNLCDLVDSGIQDPGET